MLELNDKGANFILNTEYASIPVHLRNTFAPFLDVLKRPDSAPETVVFDMRLVLNKTLHRPQKSPVLPYYSSISGNLTKWSSFNKKNMLLTIKPGVTILFNGQRYKIKAHLSYE